MGNRNTFSFIVIFLALYLCWFVVDEYRLFGLNSLHDYVSSILMHHGEAILTWMDYPLIDFSKVDRGEHAFGIDGSNGILIGAPCNGLSLFILYAVFLMAYPSAWHFKAWGIALGVLIIHVCNVLRVTGLSLISYYSPKHLEFNHSYTFNGIMYFVIFTLWYVWIHLQKTSYKSVA